MTITPRTSPGWRAVEAAKGGGPRALLEGTEPAARYAWRVMAGTLAYAASLVPEIADDMVAVDEAMRLGYNWKWGPFELLDQIGPAWFADRLDGRGTGRCRRCSERVGDGRFYRVEDGRLQFLGPTRPMIA